MKMRTHKQNPIPRSTHASTLWILAVCCIMVICSHNASAYGVTRNANLTNNTLTTVFLIDAPIGSRVVIGEQVPQGTMVSWIANGAKDGSATIFVNASNGNAYTWDLITESSTASITYSLLVNETPIPVDAVYAISPDITGHITATLAPTTPQSPLTEQPAPIVTTKQEVDNNIVTKSETQQSSQNGKNTTGKTTTAVIVLTVLAGIIAIMLAPSERFAALRGFRYAAIIATTTDASEITKEITVMRNHGITNIAIIVPDDAAVLRQHLGDGKALRVRITYFEKQRAYGSGGSLRFLKSWAKGPFVLCQRTGAAAEHFNAALTIHRQKKPLVTLFVVRATQGGNGPLVQDGMVHGFGASVYRSAGVMIINPELFSVLPEKCNIEHDVLPAIAPRNRVAAVEI